MRLGAVIAAGALAFSAGAQAEKVNYKVEVGGAKYRVTTDGDVVSVGKKKMFVRYDLKERDAQREAVLKATGCRVVDEMPNSIQLKGKLDCSARATSAPPATPL